MLMGSNSEPDNGLLGPSFNGFTSNPNPNSVSLSLPSPKRRQSVLKRVVSISIEDTEGSRAKGVSERAPPPDTWTWRKYGQKPIKGSPYPRGYYKCSSSKGCPARKQVERSRADPTTLLVTYTCDHNHQFPPPKAHPKISKPNSKQQAAAEPVKEESGSDPITQSPPESAEDSDNFSDLMMILPGDLWYSDVGSTSSTPPPVDTWLYGPIFVGSAELAAGETDKIGDFKDVGSGGGGGDDYALFEGLEELTEYSMVFRRSYFERLHPAVHQ